MSLRPPASFQSLVEHRSTIAVSGLNKILFQKLEYDHTQRKQMLINYYPGQGQMISVRFGIVSKPKSGELRLMGRPAARHGVNREL
jgi:hypothetical protein